MARGNSVTVDPRVGWALDNRGYIHGGVDTPLFAKVKHAHNSRLTRRRKKIKKSSTYGLTSPVVDDVKEKKLNA